MDASIEPRAARLVPGPVNLGEDPGSQWMLELQTGRDDAFDQIVCHYQESVRVFLHRSVRDAARVDDLAQEAFVRVWKARARYQPTASFRTWLFTIATRLALNHIRSQRREQRVFRPAPVLSTADCESASTLDRVDPQGSCAGERLELEELEHAVAQAIEDLPSKQRTAILLLREGELSYAEIAGALDLSVMAVKSLINRAREGLRTSLWRFLGPPAPSEESGATKGKV